MAQPRRPAQSSSDAVLQTLAWMRKHGFRAVPLHYQSKAAISRDYVALDYKPPGDDYWRSNNLGVGCVTGPQHSGPVDSDLDCEEAIWFAAKFMPPTPAVFGRTSKQNSHRLYKVEASSFEKLTFNDPVTKECILEMRGDGAHQTVFPGSVHEDTGELVEWSGPTLPDVPSFPADALVLAARKVALATVIARHVWQPGYHNEPTKHLTGLFYYLEWPVDDVVDLISAVMEYCGDDDKSRIPTIRAAYKRGEAGKKISGAGVLRKQLKDDALVDRILEWAGSPTINLLTEYNERFAVVSLRGKFRIAETDVPPGDAPVFFQKDDFINLVATDYSGQVTDKGAPIPKSKLWLANPRRRAYRGADFMPGVEESGAILNLWTGWAVPPAEGTCDAWLELLADVICGGDAGLTSWMLHWFANIVREPRDKSLTAPVIVGVEGAGKSLLLGYFGRILGPQYVTVTKEDHVYGKFNALQGNCLLLHSEEALYGGDKKHAGIIRSLITDTHHVFEQKGIDAVQVRNYLRLVLTSNDIYAAPAKPGDRRYTVVDMGERKADAALVELVLSELAGDGPAALHRYLLDMDYDPAIPRTNVKNDGLLALKQINMNPVESWWHDTLSGGAVLPDYLCWATVPEKIDWPEQVSSVALHASLTVKMRDRGQRGVPSLTALMFQLDKFLGIKTRQQQVEYQNPLSDEAPILVKQMSGRQSTILNMPNLVDSRRAFERLMGQQFDWPEAEKKRAPRKEQPHERY